MAPATCMRGGGGDKRAAAAATAAAATGGRHRHGLKDGARHVIGYHLTQETRNHNAADDVASINPSGPGHRLTNRDAMSILRELARRWEKRVNMDVLETTQIAHAVAALAVAESGMVGRLLTLNLLFVVVLLLLLLLILLLRIHPKGMS